MGIIFAILKAFIPGLVAKAAEAVQSKKAWAGVLGYVGITNLNDPKQQLAAAVVTGAYLIGQGIHDAAKVKAQVSK